MELPEYVNLDYLLSVKYTRTVDVSNCISISGTTFVIDTKRNSTQKENRSMYKQENRLKKHILIIDGIKLYQYQIQIKKPQIQRFYRSNYTTIYLL